jgi:hypothetical protein
MMAAFGAVAREEPIAADCLRPGEPKKEKHMCRANEDGLIDPIRAPRRRQRKTKDGRIRATTFFVRRQQ